MDSSNLLDKLPGELRNRVYAYASLSSDNPPTSQGLPFVTKTWKVCGTRTTISPVHHGNAGLLGLRNKGYREGTEYLNWLYTKGITLRIGIVFEIALSRFNQADWDKKIRDCMSKLVQKYQWLSTTARWEIRFVWDIADEDCLYAMKLGRRRKLIADVINIMTARLIKFQDVFVQKTRGDIIVAFQLLSSMAISARYYDFGLDKFLSDRSAAAAKCERREITVERRIRETKNLKLTQHCTLGTILPSVIQPFYQQVDEDGDVVDQVVSWNQSTLGILVLRKVHKGAEAYFEKKDLSVELGEDQDEMVRKFALLYHYLLSDLKQWTRGFDQALIV